MTLKGHGMHTAPEGVARCFSPRVPAMGLKPLVSSTTHEAHCRSQAWERAA